ncbi:MAG: hypothetical protein NVS9B6_03370 [Candidatus Limnocylindrales bacterium]
MDPADLAILVAGLAFAGFAKGATAMGLPLIATPILAGIFGPRAAVVIMSIPIFVSNSLLLVQRGRSFGVMRGIRPILIAGAVGSVAGVLLLSRIEQKVFAVVIAALVVFFLLRGDRILGTDPTSRRLRWGGPILGLVAGTTQGSTSIASPLIGSFFHARRLPPAQYVIVLAAIFQLNSIVQVIGFVLLGLYTPELVAIGVLGLVPTLLALMAGIWARGRLDERRFRQLIVVLLILSVANLLWRTFAG